MYRILEKEKTRKDPLYGILKRRKDPMYRILDKEKRRKDPMYRILEKEKTRKDPLYGILKRRKDPMYRMHHPLYLLHPRHGIPSPCCNLSIVTWLEPTPANPSLPIQHLLCLSQTKMLSNDLATSQSVIT